MGDGMNDGRWDAFLMHVERMSDEQRKFQAEVATQISSGFAELRGEWVETRRSINNAVLDTASRMLGLEQRLIAQERIIRVLLSGEVLLLIGLIWLMIVR